MSNKKSATPEITREIFVFNDHTISIKYKNKIEPDSAIEVNGKKPNEIVNLSEYEGNLEDYAYSEMRDFYSNYLSQTFENLVVLTGAGSSKDVGENNKGLLIKEFWDKIKDYLNEEYEKNTLDSLCEVVDYKDKNIEELLSKIFLLTSVKPELVIKPESKELKVVDVIKKIEQKIRELCDLKLPEDAPHISFLKKVTKRKASLPRVKLFTLNYDLLFEQAANKINAVLIDGFSFSLPRMFSGRNFDYDIVKRKNSRLKKDDDYLQRVLHLYKPHGSINWEKVEDGIQIDEDPSNPLMIYPRDTKYEASYEQPFFEMMSRFQNALREENTTLLTIGFSFYDKHLVTAIIEAFNQNPSFTLIIVDPFFHNSDNEVLNQLFEKAKNSPRIMLIAEFFDDFASFYPENEIYQDSKYERINIRERSFENSFAKPKSTENDLDNDDQPPF